MATLQELKKRNEQLKNQLKSQQETEAIGRERNRLLRENTILLRQRRFPGTTKFVRKFGDQFMKKTTQIGRSLVKIARKIDEAERKEEMLKKRAIRTPRKKTSKKRKR